MENTTQMTRILTMQHSLEKQNISTKILNKGKIIIAPFEHTTNQNTLFGRLVPKTEDNNMK